MVGMPPKRPIPIFYVYKIEGTDQKVVFQKVYTKEEYLQGYRNKITEGDCIKIMKSIEMDNLVDISITSPPYNVGKTTRGNLYGEYTDDKSKSEYTKWLIEIVGELIRLSKYYVFFNIQMLVSSKEAIIDLLHYYRENVKSVFIWQKTPIPQIANGKLATGYEYVIIFGKDDSMIFSYNNFPDNGYVPDIKQFLSQKKEVFKEHGATFPLDLPAFFINNFSKPGDLVLDPFSGLATTAVAAIKLNRDYMGIELDPLYVKLSNERINAEKDQSLEFLPIVYSVKDIHITHSFKSDNLFGNNL